MALPASGNSRLRTERAEVRAAKYEFQQRMEELRRQLGLNSSNNGKPPSKRRTRDRRQRPNDHPAAAPPLAPPKKLQGIDRADASQTPRFSAGPDT